MRARYDDGGPSDVPEHPSVGILEEIAEEVERQHKLAHGGNTARFDSTNTENDWIAYVAAYTGRAARKVSRNDRENQGYRENMIKAAAIIVSALVADAYKAEASEPEEAY